MSGNDLSQYQQEILEFVRSGTGNGVIRATAGAGKTTTLVAVASALPAHSKCCFLAFGRDAAAELTRRLPPSVPAMTVHKLARATLSRAARRQGRRLPAVNEGKYRHLAATHLRGLFNDRRLETTAIDEAKEYLEALLTFARLSLLPPQDANALQALIERHLLVPPADRVLAGALHEELWKIIDEGVARWHEEGSHDFTDMIYLPVRLGLAPPQFDFVCVDEAQDYSALALEFTLRLARSDGGRLLFVGDPRQSIFGFAGADVEAMARIERRAAARVLPLSISYRCPLRHIRLARLLSPEIEPRPGAPEGNVYWVNDRYLDRWARPGDLILARSTAPLLKACLGLVAAGRRAYLLGHDLEERLLGTVLAALPGLVTGRSYAVREVLSALARHARREEAGLRRRLTSSLSLTTVLSERRQLHSSLRLLVRASGGSRLDIGMLEERISQLFRPSDRAISLATVHRAKGREADRVLLLDPERMRGPYARTAPALLAEECVQFVALTRSRRDLVFVVTGDAGVPPPAPSAELADLEERPRVQSAVRWGWVLHHAWRLANERGLSRQLVAGGDGTERGRGGPDWLVVGPESPEGGVA